MWRASCLLQVLQHLRAVFPIIDELNFDADFYNDKL